MAEEHTDFADFGTDSTEIEPEPQLRDKPTPESPDFAEEDAVEADVEEPPDALSAET